MTMRRTAPVLLAAVTVLCPALRAVSGRDRPVPVIFDTDMDTDCDDAGALALLHTLADRGEVRILATVVSSKFRFSAPCVEAINRHYGRPALPIGVPKGDGASTSRGSRYAGRIALEFETALETNDDAPDARAVYRRALANAPDGSVVIVTVGYVTNLRDLLATGPDDISPLPGPELVDRKVRLWSCMGGRYPAERNPGVHGNFKPDPESAIVAVQKWPGRIDFSGDGRKIQTGKRLRTLTPPDNPVRRIYELYLGDRPTRPSWDQVALLHAVRPRLPHWKVQTTGHNHIFANGTNEWRDEPEDPRQHLVSVRPESRDAIADLIDRLMAEAPAAALADDPVYPGKSWERAEPAEFGLDAGKLREARDYALTGGGSGYITRAGRLVLEWGDPARRYDLKSSTKSIGATAVGLALADGKIELGAPARTYQPGLGVPPESNAETGWLGKITVMHLLTQTAGFAKPGGYEPLLFEPGTRWHYSDGGPNWLAECVTLIYRRDLQDLMFDRVFSILGIERSDLRWRKNAYRPETIDGIARREFGSGIHASVDAMARIGYLYLRGGSWAGRQVIPKDFIDRARTTVPGANGLPLTEAGAQTFGAASSHYGLLWWNNADGTLAGVPRDAYWSWGLHDSLIVVIPSLDLVVSRAGKSWPRSGGGHYEVLAPFLEPIVAAVRPADDPPQGSTASPVGPSPVIRGIVWAAPETIVRRARGSDNWPITWGDDGAQYTAYGDGRGFEPRVESKLSLGFARITGEPGGFDAENIRSPGGETRGDGPSGLKASGLLMLDGTLYMWARNAKNSRLAWSTDHARTWTWSDWRFTESFGCPTFLNFGPNYRGARDDFVYVYSFDSDSAYEPADRMVLARAPRDRLTERRAYEFFREIQDGEPEWTGDVSRRGGVFHHSRRCYRSGITHDAALGRYLWCQIMPGGDTRFEGGIGIYDAPEPWGPWTTVHFAARWDVGPGESASFPTRWMSEDGRVVHLVFSGEDCFSVRRARLLVR